MELTVGSVVDGKVTGITKFGAFVSLPDKRSGLVHISEIANTYVNDVKDFLKEGQDVKVKIINVDDQGRLNLSIKKAMPEPETPAAPAPRRDAPRNFAPRTPSAASPRPEPGSFEDKLKQFMQDSDAKIAGSKQYANEHGSRRPRRSGPSGS